ncbi:MAG: hypothetical protein NTY29_06920, partial [Proteobacteria bacterium]|nr:hypothetical protein [Pseudomonadota bacterium]
VMNSRQPSAFSLCLLPIAFVPIAYLPFALSPFTYSQSLFTFHVSRSTFPFPIHPFTDSPFRIPQS